MTRMIFPNLAVSDIEAAKAFYSAIGFPVNPQFTNEVSSAVVVSDHIVVMLLAPSFAKESGLTQTSAPAMSLALSLDSRDEVDALFAKAIEAGAAQRGDTVDMENFMYSRGFTDPDGHMWDVLWMNPDAVEG